MTFFENSAPFGKTIVETPPSPHSHRIYFKPPITLTLIPTKLIFILNKGKENLRAFSHKEETLKLK